MTESIVYLIVFGKKMDAFTNSPLNQTPETKAANKWYSDLFSLPQISILQT